ncbi:MAG: bifunctional 4-hydroxy-2-oxoglutarate aldolase/2-dehydro-3-deoxy-phosphogluconate aldolase [Treponema sp.]|jgi:2-dehydro-3-deoxyphosphogluconate aldolase/(4S)-4-hydroxy-2-oxoglutarate aldolase|nr:bifunctional 4-hydroxy-2-oxoglutarate aldolase/2-dehydro-3-deoxy-phosphogluconate aldolase [Treponema sp.]
MNAVLEKIGKIGIVPVIKIDDAAKAVPLAKALIKGGIPCAEITFRTASGEEAIRRVNAEVPDILLGAGTVLSTAQVDKAIAAGAKFIVSPGFNPKIVACCAEKGIPITPGCSNPSDIEMAIEAGLDVVKFFPAEQAGGLDYIKAIAAPYGNIKFMPTGGINADNIAKYTAYEKILACGGSWMVNADLINAGDFDKISALCREALLSMLGFSMVHIGINTGSEDEALKGAKLFESLFGFNLKIGSSSIFASDKIEVLKSQGTGRLGHIAIASWSVPKAIGYLERLGMAFNYDSAKRATSGDINVIYLKDEILGFGVHLLQT